MTMLRQFALAATAIICSLLLWSLTEAASDPLVRRGEFGFADWPNRSPALKAVLISDIHVAGPDMPPARLARIVDQINRLRPDLVLIAGDLVSDKRLATSHYSMAEAIAPLAGFKPKLGAFAVLGNHDHWRDAGAARQALRRAGIKVLDNQAVRAGPLVIAGAGDAFTGRDDPEALASAAARLGGPALVLSHSPDIAPKLDPRFRLVLAGHTHCGQIAPPLIGRLATASEHGERYACGMVRDKGRVVVVSAGLGTSLLPLRMGARPDMWLMELGPIRSAEVQ